MTNKIVLVDHHHEPPDNLVSTLLSDRGFALEWQRPFAGDTLEPPDTVMSVINRLKIDRKRTSAPG